MLVVNENMCQSTALRVTHHRSKGISTDLQNLEDSQLVLPHGPTSALARPFGISALAAAKGGDPSCSCIHVYVRQGIVVALLPLFHRQRMGCRARGDIKADDKADALLELEA